MPEVEPRIVIIGAGPTGLGAAWRLQEVGHRNWILVDQAGEPGGLSSSVVDDEGFTWDLGGHVLFSHYRYFDALMDTAAAHWVEHQREAWVWIRGRWVPYPLQYNVWRLPEPEAQACIEGMRAAQGRVHAGPPASFGEWLRRSFGEGLCATFMVPYNQKVWAYHPDTLDVGWMGERVPSVDLERVLRNQAQRREDVSWGPNATFRFPLHGGTGAIWKGVAARLPGERIQLGRRVVAVDSGLRRVTFADGSVEAYDRLLSTVPLDCLLGMLVDRPELAAEASNFVHSSTHVVGVGLDGPVPELLRTKCWMYFSEAECPFYRCTVFSNYSPNNVPQPGRQWSLMAEVSESPEKPVDGAAVVNEVVAGMRATGLLGDGDRIVSRWHRRLPYGYPTPWLGRDATLGRVQPALEACGILSRGRFGAWKYEVSNQDHSVMQGVEAVDRWLTGAPERVVRGG